MLNVSPCALVGLLALTFFVLVPIAYAITPLVRKVTIDFSLTTKRLLVATTAAAVLLIAVSVVGNVKIVPCHEDVASALNHKNPPTTMAKFFTENCGCSK